MASMSNFLENKLLDWFLRAQAIGVTGATAAAGTGLATAYVALFTAAPTDAGGGTEVSGGSYARVAVTSSLANWSGTSVTAGGSASSGTDGTVSNVGVITFPTPSANWGTITSVGIFDASTGGNLLLWGNLSANKTVNNGDPAPTFPANTLSWQIDN